MPTASPCLQFQLLLYHIFCLYTHTHNRNVIYKSVQRFLWIVENNHTVCTSSREYAHIWNERGTFRDRQTVNYSFYPDVAIETLHGYWKRSDVPCLRCYREAQEPIKFFDIGCCHGSPTIHIERYRYTARIQRYAFKVTEQTNFIKWCI